MKENPPPNITIQSSSQFGEDALILKFFGGKTDGFFVEVGANDPVNLSQTFLLEQTGWRTAFRKLKSVLTGGKIK